MGKPLFETKKIVVLLSSRRIDFQTPREPGMLRHLEVT
jgi:hypothetical protein